MPDKQLYEIVYGFDKVDEGRMIRDAGEGDDVLIGGQWTEKSLRFGIRKTTRGISRSVPVEFQ